MANFTAILDLVEHILTIIALTSGIIVAWLGLATWRKQIAGETEHDLARRTLKVVYEFRETVFWSRTVGLFEDTNARSQAISSSMQGFNIILIEVEALWGKELKELVYNIQSMGYRILAALELERRKKIKINKEHDSILVASTNKSDKFSQELENMIEKLQVNLQPKLLIRKKRIWKRRNKIKS